MDLSLYASCGAAERAPRIPALTFPEILSDPLVRLVMKADGVDPKALERDLWDIAASLPARPKRNASGCLPLNR
jgi:hypothetical protein